MSQLFKDRMADYVPVNERIEAFKNDWPEGSLQSQIVELTADRVTIKAYAYRTPDDQRPGIGHSSLEIPGSTPYTKGSEIENAETSAWGRAIAALGFEVKRGIASREEVRNKPADQPKRSPFQRTAEEQTLLDELLAIPGMTKARMTLLADAVGVTKGTHANADQLREMLTVTFMPLPPAIETPSAGAVTPAAATEPPADPPGGAAAQAPTLDDILAATGGELVPPVPGSDEYKALSGPERASARAYHSKATTEVR